MRIPYVRIELPLAARSGGPGCLVRVSSPVAGMTLTSAPVSTRNCRLETASQTKRRPLFWPVTVTITGDRPFRFPAKSKVACIAGLPSRTCGGNNTNGCRGEERGPWILSPSAQ